MTAILEGIINPRFHLDPCDPHNLEKVTHLTRICRLTQPGCNTGPYIDTYTVTAQV